MLCIIRQLARWAVVSVSIVPFFFFTNSPFLYRYAEAKHSNRVCIAGKSPENFENRSMRSISLFIGQVETGIPCRCTGARRNALISEEIRNLLRSTSNHASHIRPIYISDSLLGKNSPFQNRITGDFVATVRYSNVLVDYNWIFERSREKGSNGSSERLFSRSKMKHVRCFVTFDPASTLSTPLRFDDTDTFDNFQTRSNSRS